MWWSGEYSDADVADSADQLMMSLVNGSTGHFGKMRQTDI